MTLSVRCVALLALVMVAGACGGGSHPRDVVEGRSGESSCAAVLQFDGRVYDGLGVRVAVEPGRDLGSGSFPSCDDTGEGAGQASAVEVAAFPGIRPKVAVLTPGD